MGKKAASPLKSNQYVCLTSLYFQVKLRLFENKRRKAGAELCQAQWKLGLAKLALPLTVVIFHLKHKKIMVVFHMPKMEIVF